MDVSHTFSDNLKRYMADREITTNGLATTSGMSQKTIWAVINARSSPTIETAVKICEALDIDLRLVMTKRLSPNEVEASRRMGKAIDQLMNQ